MCSAHASSALAAFCVFREANLLSTVYLSLSFPFLLCFTHHARSHFFGCLVSEKRPLFQHSDSSDALRRFGFTRSSTPGLRASSAVSASVSASSVEARSSCSSSSSSSVISSSSSLTLPSSSQSISYFSFSSSSSLGRHRLLSFPSDHQIPVFLISPAILLLP